MRKIKCFDGKFDVVVFFVFIVGGIALYSIFRHLYLDILIMAAFGLITGLITSDIKNKRRLK